MFMKKLVLLSCTAFSLSGCLEPPTAERFNNSAPAIQGTPITNATINSPYEFTATALDNDGDELSYIIDNKPSWAEFDEVTGQLTGTPNKIGIDENVRVGVSDGMSRSYLPIFDITTNNSTNNSTLNGGTNQAPTVNNQVIDATVNVQTVVTLGPTADIDGDLLSYTVSNSLNIQIGPESNQATYLNTATETELIDVTVSDGINEPVNAELTIRVSLASPSNYVTHKNIIEPDFGATAPVKGESRIDPTTGAKITRLTDASEMPGTDDALIVYSRYSPENSSGQYVLSFGTNSTSAWVIDRESTNIIRKLLHTGNKEIGEVHEIRWDTSGAHPNRVYYRYNLALYMINDVTAETIQSTLIKDFASVIPASSTKIYNDVEGDSSNDSDHWAFMAAHYNGVTYVVDAFVHYQISTDTTHTLTPADLAGTSLNHYASEASFPRPNMVEVSPLGTGIILHYGRSWGDSNYGVRSDDIGTWFDGAHIWPLDFDHSQQEPVKISIGETHSGWAFDEEGKELFISQNNRTDQLDAIYVSGNNSGYENRIEMATHSDFGWSNGFHYGKMPTSKPGWVFINTYSNINNQYHDTDWGADQLILMELKPKSENPTAWRISPNYNKYDGNYRDEAPAAINLLGNRIYVSTNWGGELNNREVFLFELPNSWKEDLEE